MVKTRVIQSAQGAHAYPLLIKSLLLSGGRSHPEREIVYADKLRYDYRTLKQRIHRLANMLTAAGVMPGDTVALLDWDSHRALECFFAVPMIGAVLHTVNVRFSADQIAYTMNHAEDNLVLVHDDFLPVVESLAETLTTVRGYIQLSDEESKATSLPVLGEYEPLLAAAGDRFDFPDFDENSVATLFYTTGTTGNPKGSTSAIVSWSCTRSMSWASWQPTRDSRCYDRTMSTCRSLLCFTCTPGALPMSQQCLV